MLYCARSSCVNFIEHLLRPSALLDLVNIVQVELDLRNATGAQNLLLKFTQPNRAQYRNTIAVGCKWQFTSTLYNFVAASPREPLANLQSASSESARQKLYKVEFTAHHLRQLSLF